MSKHFFFFVRLFVTEDNYKKTRQSHATKTEVIFRWTA